jgi:hypothetical protein
LSEAEALKLIETAEVRETVSERQVDLRQVDDQVLVNCSQEVRFFQKPGRPGGGGGIIACGGACKLNAGAKFADCKTSGCLVSNGKCTPLVCSGGCTLSRACKSEKPIVFGF